jgi:hypothetical protein
MSTSLLFALLEVSDHTALQAAAPGTLSLHAERYRQLTPNQQRRVRQALYDAFYAILEGQRIDYGGGNASEASMAIGGGLARYISENLSPMTQAQRDHRTTLKTVLQTWVHQAIVDILD